MNTRLFRGDDIESRRDRRHDFDPIAEGHRYGLVPAVSLAIWAHACREATDPRGQLDEARAQQRFHEVAARVAARGGRLVPDIGKVTRVDVALHGDSPTTLLTDELLPRVPGRTTLVVAEERRWEQATHEWMAATGMSAASGESSAAHDELPGATEMVRAITALHATSQIAHAQRPRQKVALPDALLVAATKAPSAALLFAGSATLRERRLATAVSGNDRAAAARDSRSDFARDAGDRAPTRRREVDHGHLALRARTRRDPEKVLASLSPSSGRPMADEHRVRFEQAFGRDFSHVRIHTGSDAVRAAEDLSAHAFAVGSHIYFGAGEYAPGSEAGDRLLAHELTHVVQHDNGQVPRAGVSSPSDASEQEAYCAESRIVGILARLDDDGPLALDPAQRAPDTSHYRGAPTSAVQRDAADGEPARGPSTSEASLMGPLPTAASVPRGGRKADPAPGRPPGPRPGPARTPRPATPAAGPRNAAAPTPAAAPAAQTSGAPQVPLAPTIVQPPTVAPLAPPATVPTAAPALGPNATAWAAEARTRGAQRAAELESAATTAQASIQSAARATIAATAARFTAARTALESAAATAIAAVDARAAAAQTELTTLIATSRTGLDEGIARRREVARVGNDAAKLEIDAIVEGEASRAIDGCAERAEAAGAVADLDGGGGDQPLADARRDMANKVAAASRAQCARTGSDTAAEVRRVGAARRDGMDSYLVELEASLDTAAGEAHAKLDTLATEAGQAITAESNRARGDVTAHCDSGRSYLDGKQTEHAAWVQAEATRECLAMVTRAPAQSAEVIAGYDTLASRYDQAAAELALGRSELGPNPDPGLLAEANQRIALELARWWSQAAATVEPKVTSVVGSYDAQAAQVVRGFTSAQLDLETKIQTASTGAIADLTSAPTHFAQLAGELHGKAQQASTDGVAATLARADAAEAHRATDTATYVQDTRSQISGAVDQQLTWQDEQLAQSSRELAEGQARAGTEYQTIKADAQAKDSAGASTAIMRGWLGDLWDWFGDLADSVLEWMQEKLGKVWGSILGGILWFIIEAVGVVACAVAWVGAQLINLVWGFIWGETAIPGYGGGFVAFIGDIIAGVLVYGDVRDIFKYWILYPLLGEGPWWLNLLLGGIALLGLIPLFGDTLKGIFKGGKAIAKVGLERLIKELGQELAERLVREVGEEVAVDLLDKLGKEALQKLASHMAGDAIEKLVKDFGELTIKRLLKEIEGPVIRAIGDDVGQEGLEKLARTLGGAAIQELHEKLGKESLTKLLDGLRGVTIKEYFDRLGADTLKKLAKDLDGYAVKQLVDDLGDAALKSLTRDLEGAAIKHLAEELGAEALKKLAAKLDGSVIKQLVEDITGAEVKRLLGALGDELFCKLAKELDGHIIKQLVDDLTVVVVKDLAEKLSAKTLKELHQELGKDTLKRFATSLGADGLKQITDKLSARELKAFTTELGPDMIEQFGAKALAEVGSHFTPTQLLDLLTTPGTTTGYLRALCETAGAGAALKSAVGHFGAIAELGKVLAKAEAATMSGEVLKEFLGACTTNGFKNIAEITRFFDYVVSHGVSDAAFRKAMQGGAIFVRHSAGNTVKTAGRTIAEAAPIASRVLTLADGSTITVTLGNHDVLHIASRHTWEWFAMVMSNVKPDNTMFAETIGRTEVSTIAQNLLNSADVRAKVLTMLRGANEEFAAGGFMVRINLNSGVDGLIALRPIAGGAGVIDMPDYLMRAAIALWKSL